MKIKKSLFLCVLFFVLTGYAEEEIERKTRIQVAPPMEPAKYREVDRFDLSVILNSTDVVIGESKPYVVGDRFTSDLEQYGDGELTIGTLLVESFVGGANPEIEGEISILNPIDARKDQFYNNPERYRSIRFLRKLSVEEIEELKESLTLTYRREIFPDGVIPIIDADGNKIVGEQVLDSEYPSIRVPSDLWVWAKEGNDRRWSTQRLGENPGDPLPGWENPLKGYSITVTKPLELKDFLERKAEVEPTESAIVSYLSELMPWLQEVRR
ncbi:MAG: hypothetical protein LAT55_13590, partial [Opitutales bacterium]|nr:hypothetical protein [Opitutales bacterium]